MTKVHTGALDQSHLDRVPFQAYWAAQQGDFQWIDIPVLTEVVPGLWVGGAPEPRVPDGIDFVVNLYAPWARYDANGAEVRDVPNVDDDDIDPELAKLFLDIAREVNSRLSLGQTVLVHCQAGLNRSATAVALALMLRGMEASDAIGLLREKRHRLVLCNPHFEQWLRRVEMDAGEESRHLEPPPGSPMDRIDHGATHDGASDSAGTARLGR